MIGSVLGVVYAMLSQWSEPDYEQYQQNVNNILAHDVRWALMRMNSLFFDEETFVKTKDEMNQLVEAVLKLIQD